VEEFKYLGINIKEKNNMYNEIKIRICAANRSYYAMKEMFSYVLIKASVAPNEREVIYYIFAPHSNVCM
jgi:hypothetical protein